MTAYAIAHLCTPQSMAVEADPGTGWARLLM